MSITKKKFTDAVQSAIKAPSKSGTKWDLLESLFAAEGLRGNGAINNGSGADRTTRIRQLGTSKVHKGHDTRNIASHSVFVIGGNSVATYNNNPTDYTDKFMQALKDDHSSFETCLLMLAPPNKPVDAVLLVKRSEQQPQIPYDEWWPDLEVIVLPTITGGPSDSEAESPLYLCMDGSNVIFFGPPGTGKSTEVKARLGAATIVRTQFHPEYSHSDFIGSYRPVVGSEIGPSDRVLGNDNVSMLRPVNYFAFVPGPFALALKCAFENPTYHVFLVIEEINRGDCSAIFGDVFQLLDRDDNGRSEFGITAKPELLTYFEGKRVIFDIAGDGQLYLPPNLSLLATMNTSDQSLYPMDSAFKRRWQWVACPIDFDQVLTYTDGVRPFLYDGKEKWDWIQILELLNKKIVRASMEDKQLGPWFIKPAEDGSVPWEAFLNKCLFYLWHDVFKDDQKSDLSPFKTDGPGVFGEVQANIRARGLRDGFKTEFLIIADSDNASFPNILDPTTEQLTEDFEGSS